MHVGCHIALVPPPVCDGAGGPRGQLTSPHHPRCSVCGLKGPGACGEPFSSVFEVRQQEPQGWASGPGAVPGPFTVCSGTDNARAWAEAGAAALGLGVALVNEWWSLMCPNLSWCPSHPALPPWAGSLWPPHLQNWRE